jgi:putative endonuclease
MPDWYVYMIECDKKSFYTGVSTDPTRRFEEHQSRSVKAAKYTRACNLLELQYQVKIGAKSQAMRLEYFIKRLPHQLKRTIVAAQLDAVELTEFLENGHRRRSC